MEFGSGEEGLRPQSYFFVFSFLEYVFTDIQKYEEAPMCVACLFPLSNNVFFPSVSFDN